MPRRYTRRKWAVEHTETDGVPKIRVTCRKCQWKIDYNSYQAAVHYNTCSSHNGPNIQVSIQQDDELPCLPKIHEPSLLLSLPIDSANNTFEMFVQEMERFRAAQLIWKEPIIKELIRTWKVFENKFEEWVKNAYLQVEKFKDEGLAEEADKLATLLAQSDRVARPGEFEFLYSVPFGEKLVSIDILGTDRPKKADDNQSDNDESKGESCGILDGRSDDDSSCRHASVSDVKPIGNTTITPPGSKSTTPARTLPPRACRRQV
ncbi:hypothetical protein GGR51DRAFT_484591 [Nemania sp. FL0031]|nr:hypothetical protein GGR51DRAFT_484591 [Nemania sp. FL0031]